MFCDRCGSYLADGQSYCNNCGAPAPVPQAVPVLSQGSPYQAAGQPLVQSVEVDSRFAQKVQIEPPKKYIINPLGRAGLICGILGVATTWAYLTNIVPAILGICFSLAGMKKTKELGGRGNCIAGLILSCSGILLWIIALISIIYQLTFD